MRKKNTSAQSVELLNYFNKTIQQSFEFVESKLALPTPFVSPFRELPSGMTKRGHFIRIQNGVYNLITNKQNPVTFLSYWHLFAKPIRRGIKYYIAYYLVLQRPSQIEV